MRWTKIMEMRWWAINNTKCRSNSQKRTQSKIKSRRLFRFALITMLFLETLSSPPTTLLSIMTHQILQSMPWICHRLSGRDHRKSQLRSHLCQETKWTQEILSKEFLETAGSWDLFLSKAPIQNFWKTWLSITVSSMDSLYSNSSRMDAGNMSLLILESHTTPRAKLHCMATALTKMNFGFP